VLRADIHHGPWLLREASATITSNTMMEAAGIRTTDSAALFHIAARQDVLTWPPHRADAPRRRA
jgi:hypothetical protein